jgi:hypothetical protein
MDPVYERDKMIGARHPRRSRWLLALGALTVAALFVWSMPLNQDRRELSEGGEVGARQGGSSQAGNASPESRPQDLVGTAGSHEGAKPDEDATVLREIETITGANDAMALVGRRVDLHVDVQARANDHAFWVGPTDNRVLVVWGRDNRDSSERQAGAPASDEVALVRDGQRAAISGVIEPIPIAEGRFSWDLTEQDQRELGERKVYIRADSVKPES